MLGWFREGEKERLEARIEYVMGLYNQSIE